MCEFIEELNLWGGTMQTPVVLHADRRDALARDRLTLLNSCPQCGGARTSYLGRSGRGLKYKCECGLVFGVSLSVERRPLN